jgi:hypothetical protein
MNQTRDKELYKSFSFPMKLYTMLEDAQGLSFEDIVSWQPGGQSFKVLQPERFATEISQTYFNQTKYKSFQRQLNIYGFRRIHSGINKGGYAHHRFNRSDTEACKLIARQADGSKATAPNSSSKVRLRIHTYSTVGLK